MGGVLLYMIENSVQEDLIYTILQTAMHVVSYM